MYDLTFIITKNYSGYIIKIYICNIDGESSYINY